MSYASRLKSRQNPKSSDAEPSSNFRAWNRRSSSSKKIPFDKNDESSSGSPRVFPPNVKFALKMSQGIIMDFQKQDGSWYRGVFQKCTPGELHFGWVQRLDSNEVEPYIQEYSIPMQHVLQLRYSFPPVQNEIGSSGSRESVKGFRTDVEISRVENRIENRVLQRFECDTNDQLLTLEEYNEDKEWDQFEENEKVFGVKSTYNELLYTEKIDFTDPNFSIKEKKAAAIAYEILNQVPESIHVAEERDVQVKSLLDEESRYSTVLSDAEAKASENVSTLPSTKSPEQKTVSKKALNPNAPAFEFNIDAKPFEPEPSAMDNVLFHVAPMYPPESYAFIPNIPAYPAVIPLDASAMPPVYVPPIYAQPLPVDGSGMFQPQRGRGGYRGGYRGRGGFGRGGHPGYNRHKPETRAKPENQ